jgi:hypothetical protein
MDPEVFEGFAGQLHETLRVQGLREYFEMRKHWFEPRFRGYLEGLIAESDAITEYYGFVGCES